MVLLQQGHPSSWDTGHTLATRLCTAPSRPGGPQCPHGYRPRLRQWPRGSEDFQADTGDRLGHSLLTGDM